MNYAELHARSASVFCGEALRQSIWPLQRRIFICRHWHSAIVTGYLVPHDFTRGTRMRNTADRRQRINDGRGSVLPVIVQSRNGYQNLCRLLSRAKLRSPKNESSIRWSELSEFREGLICLTGDEEGPLHRALTLGIFPEPINAWLCSKRFSGRIIYL
jgi:DNA polymerase III, alpha subunit